MKSRLLVAGAIAMFCGGAVNADNLPGTVPANLIQPLFPRLTVLEKGGISPEGRAFWNASWKGREARNLAADDWRGGGDAVGQGFGSYDVVDRIFARLGDSRKYPNLKRVILAGFSAGGQFVGRYAAVGKGVVRPGVTLDYVALSPSTELRFDPEVPWHYGLKGRPRYSATLTDDQILANLSARRVWWGCGARDTGDRSLDRSLEARAQGENRLMRFRNFRDHVQKFPAWAKQVSFREFPGLGHEASKAYADPELQRFLFR